MKDPEKAKAFVLSRYPQARAAILYTYRGRAGVAVITSNTVTAAAQSVVCCNEADAWIAAAEYIVENG